ncbi:carbamoyl phosphate synthase small subunit [Buchnera aphidicola (Nipponaphis monzeni)]|uniref:Carbamoyl phosphate synthase small chain n=1 Tax=Buchnera aphidicola (Nipponaphis monzeni) TaxID=2495405 RepID=A0A455T9Z5_9GAMM|nr:glutamine-hydrolyzing carbamoyl-phosphate synthase small subunit [Buchnera aphidicola]BBI01130.1 carbamoyl phosphate synthase small subunit [Buchnera aphidicola (Nipponaphis monzeni)]
MRNLATLVLENGIIFHGESLGIEGSVVGEIVFNTAMTGYQEIITDPSYLNQIVILTHPHIGNTGTNLIDMESDKIYIKGLIIKNVSETSDHFNNQKNFIDYLKDNNVITITEIDTRKLTRMLRKLGSLKGCLYTSNKENYYTAYKKAFNFDGSQGFDLVKEVSTKFIYQHIKHDFPKKIFNTSNIFQLKDSSKIHIVVYDFGVKRNILKLLISYGCNLTIVPADTRAKCVLKLLPDGIFLSNGPGDPKPCVYAINAIKIFLEKNIPMFGVCLGHQLLALANGARIIKMKCGHHGSNHPVKNVLTNKVIITSQNHGFTVDLKTLPKNIQITHKSLFDGTLQGLSLKNKFAFSFQGHPESSPGPHDSRLLFNKFINMCIQFKQNN